ncbi:GNAT family N-acetyltransferase [Flagellimonas algicola]|uniref:GNAT family N-acetyltransferase n=1 Tax=Flagellimonas algicola TaxID=2583815 RepID=A0ABY2WI06_9FLAO|nr:GNAT family N-acetyltransferase [Allomuricauda algicola]TMU54478.1 GNAT family N-acetyltransferase [Allomuricauda algicola]
MEFIQRSSLSMSEKLQLMALWNIEYPEKLGYKSIAAFEAYLENLKDPSHILLIDENKRIKGWYFDFERENEKWFAIILNSEVHGKGIGTKILGLAKQRENELNGWVIDHNRDKKKNGESYHSPLNFYLKNGFEKLAANRLELDNISAVKIKWPQQKQKPNK